MVSTEEQVRRLQIIMKDKKMAKSFLSEILQKKVMDVEIIKVPYEGDFRNPIRPVDVKITLEDGEINYVQLCVNEDEEMMHNNRQYFEKFHDYLDDHNQYNQ